MELPGSTGSIDCGCGEKLRGAQQAGEGELRRKQPAAAAKERIMRSDWTERRQSVLSASAEHLL